MFAVEVRHKRNKEDVGGKLFNQQSWRDFYREARGRKLFLFGAGNACNEFLLEFAKKIQAEGIFENNEKICGTNFRGLPIISSKEIHRYSADDIIILITTVDHDDEIGEELNRAGYRHVFSIYALEARELDTVKRKIYDYFFKHHFGFFHNHNLFRNYILFHIMAVLRVLHFPPAYLPYKGIKEYKNIHRGERCFIIATGPSLKVEDIEKIHQHGDITFSMNSIFNVFNQTNWRPDYYVIEDPKFDRLFDWDNEKYDIDKACVRKAFLSELYKETSKRFKKVQLYPISYLGHLMKRNDKRMIYSDNFIWGIYCAFTVTNVCMQLAEYMGFSKIYLLGVDCNYNGKQKHFAPEQDDKKYSKKYADEAYENLIRGFTFMRDNLKRRGVEVYNATRGGMLEVFPRVRLEDIYMEEKRNPWEDIQINTMRELAEHIGKRNVIIYGAGGVSRILTECLWDMRIRIQSYVVTKKGARDPREIYGISVQEFRTALDAMKKGDAVTIIAVKGRGMQIQILEALMAENVRNVVLMSDVLDENMREYYAKESAQKILAPNFFIDTQQHIDPRHYYIYEKSSGKCIGRIHKELSMPLRNGFDPWKGNLKENIVSQYGEICDLDEVDFTKHFTDNHREYVYAAKSSMDRDKNYFPLESNLVRVVWAGAAISDCPKTNVLRDDQGDNISARNRNYSECTVLYWIWKHITSVSYIGLCHYRRMFRFPFDDLRALNGSGIDVIIPPITICNSEIRHYFSNRFILPTDWSLMKEGIHEYGGSWGETFAKYERGHFVILSNIFVMKKEIFDEYCSFAFFVANYIEEKYAGRHLQRQDRYMGYIFENLLGIFIMHNKDRIKCATGDLRFYGSM